MRFQSFANFLELLESFREFFFHFRNVHRCTNAGNNVLALSVGQELAEQVPFCKPVAGSRVNATPVPQSSPMLPKAIICTFTAVPPGIWDVVVAAVNVCTGIIPGTEYSLNSAN